MRIHPQTLTAFIPTDQAFRRLARDVVGGKAGGSERSAFKALAGAVDVDTIETVLLYHVVAGQKLDSTAVVGADGTPIQTAQGGEITPDVDGETVRVVDLDTSDKDAKGVAFDLNAQANQIAHAIDRVLRPVDLP